MFQSKMSLYFITLVLGVTLNISAKAQQTRATQDVSLPPEVQQVDTQRLYKGLVDLGIYQTYRFTPQDLKKLSESQAEEIIKIYINNYYVQYMYFSKNLIMQPVSDNYPATVIDEIQKTVNTKYKNKNKQLLTQFHREKGGVTMINSLLYDVVSSVINKYEVSKFGQATRLQLPPYHSPNALYLAYMKKLNLRPLAYNPPFNPEMDVQVSVEKFKDALINLPEEKTESLTQSKSSLLDNKWVYLLAGFLLGLLVSFLVSALRKNDK
ncbi:MAG: hypothetical protein ACK41T_04475 [Pseudobdellovibrio sp.]